MTTTEYRITERTVVGSKIERREVERFASKAEAQAAYDARGLIGCTEASPVWHTVDTCRVDIPRA